jgi:hypothetical protein
MTMAAGQDKNLWLLDPETSAGMRIVASEHSTASNEIQIPARQARGASPACHSAGGDPEMFAAEQAA